jgi:hypothetical protein
MEFDVATSNSSTVKRKQPYTQPKARALTPEQAESEVLAKALPGSQELQTCFELIAEARKRKVRHDD